MTAEKKRKAKNMEKRTKILMIVSRDLLVWGVWVSTIVEGL